MKRISTIILSFALMALVAMPVLTNESFGAVTAGTSMPSYTSAEGKAYYYTDKNVFYKYNLGPSRKYLSVYGGYCVGNCTWYAYGRASEILGVPLNSNLRWSASQWWSTNKKGNYYAYGSKPKVGAIACYGGHVAIVEKIVGSKVYVSESGWKVSKTAPASSSNLYFHYGTPWNSDIKGYIYITDSALENAVSVDYSVKVTVSTLNMRTGPGTEYGKIGYIKPGTYKVNQQCGNWVKLTSNGYWICLNYATKVKTAATTVVDTGTATNSKVKVAITNLNMRTGPATTYGKKGYIKPGTYSIVKTSNSWGKLADSGYWIYLKYTTAVSTATTADTNTNAAATTPAPSTGTTQSSASLYKVKINTGTLNMRTGPGTNYSKKGTIKKGSVYNIKDTNNGWGQLSDNGYWIKLSYTIPVDSAYNVKVSVTSLRMRTGPSTGYGSKGYIKPGVYTIASTSNGWGKLSANGYWIKLSYTTKL